MAKKKRLAPLKAEQLQPEAPPRPRKASSVVPTAIPTQPSERTDAQTTAHTAEQTAEQTDAQTMEIEGGDTAAAVAVLDADCSEGPSRTRDRSPAYVVKVRLEKEGRWKSIEPIRDDMMTAARKQGLEKSAAQAWVYAELDRLYPPLPPKPVDKPEPVAAQEVMPPDDKIGGLGLIPEAWPRLPANASLQSELSWVQSNRLVVVEDVAGRVVVHLEKSLSPAPSMSALGWLETSIRSYAKYVDVVAKTLAMVVDEQDSVRRERMRLDEIQTLLEDMHSDG